MTGVAGAEEIKDSTLDCMASPTSKAFRESRPRRLMSLVLPITTQVDNIVVPSVYSDSRKQSQKVRYDCGQWTPPCVLLTDRDQLCRCGEARHVTKLPRDDFRLFSLLFWEQGMMGWQ